MAVVTDTDSRCGTRWLLGIDAQERMRLLAALFSRFNHDLRTPLNTILGWTHLLQKGGLDPLRAKHVADVIARNSRDQTQLLEDFVDDGRAILNTLQLQMGRFRFEDLLTQAIERIGSVLTLHGVSLKQQLQAADVSVNGDGRRLERLAYRLLCVITRRAREASTVDVKTSIERSGCELSISGTAYEPDWSDAALLDLRISTLIAALHGGELEVGADATHPCVEIRLPQS